MKSGRLGTVSGKFLDYLDPNPDTIDIEDIAQGLSHVCRFSGQLEVHYSVAQHSVVMTGHLRRTMGDREVLLQALLHDASEAYLCDVIRPLKHGPGFEAYRAAEARLQSVIYQTFGLPSVEHEVIHEYDNRMLRTEQRDVMPNNTVVFTDAYPFALRVVPWTWHVARERFLALFADLDGEPR